MQARARLGFTLSVLSVLACDMKNKNLKHPIYPHDIIEMKVNTVGDPPSPLSDLRLV